MCMKTELEFGVLVFVEGEKPDNPEKYPRNKEENQQHSQPTCDAKSGNRTLLSFGRKENKPKVVLPII